jgi:ribulose-5-phosphate 4-epimerase/fuculose-1-phosphate aldolase
MIVGTPEKGRRIGVEEGYGSVSVRKDDNKTAITTTEMCGNLKENDNVSVRTNNGEEIGSVNLHKTCLVANDDNYAPVALAA